MLHSSVLTEFSYVGLKVDSVIVNDIYPVHILNTIYYFHWFGTDQIFKIIILKRDYKITKSIVIGVIWFHWKHYMCLNKLYIYYLRKQWIWVRPFRHGYWVAWQIYMHDYALAIHEKERFNDTSESFGQFNRTHLHPVKTAVTSRFIDCLGFILY